MKKLLALVLALAMTLSLAACGQKEETPSDGGNDGAEKVTLQIGFTTAEDPNDPYYYAANEMARILEEKVRNARCSKACRWARSKWLL